MRLSSNGSCHSDFLTTKQKNEQIVFGRFIERFNQQNQWGCVSSRPEPEPDLLCVHVTDGPIAFELVSLTDDCVAKVQAAGSKAIQKAFPTSDPSTRILQKKLSKSYKTNTNHIELLIYTDGQIITPDDVIIPTVCPLFSTVQHPFKRIWFMGEFENLCLLGDR